MIADTFVRLGGWSWIILGVVLIGLELVAPGAFLIWLGIAAVATGLLGMVLDLSWQVAALAFAGLSVVSVLAGRAVNRPSRHDDTTASLLNRRGQALVGRVFVLEAPIRDGEGRIRVDDSSWRVTGADQALGTRVRVVRVDGATLVVEAA
ncbi:NfeD family protein [Microvirga pudoricolor]|uniref:NfeD family protein n=1 Tax=Microvirga pudoricolor TaxID=2778729 RepID=UPI00194F7E71|nr:NfeD family protein [Microvirga pudoricolor]MBM6594914.1 NfeD family protein [Microvirga pudoricolor]